MISPDPNLEIDELGVPVHIARVLTYPERVFSENLSQLRRLVLNGPDVWPGANYVESAGAGNKRSLKFGDRRRAASELKAGDPNPNPNPLTLTLTLTLALTLILTLTLTLKPNPLP